MAFAFKKPETFGLIREGIRNMNEDSRNGLIIANYNKFYIPVKKDDSSYSTILDVRPIIPTFASNGVCKDMKQLVSYARIYHKRKTLAVLQEQKEHAERIKKDKEDKERQIIEESQQEQSESLINENE